MNFFYDSVIADIVREHKRKLSGVFENRLINLLVFFTVIFDKVINDKNINELKVIDLGCGSSHSDDLKYIDDFIWQPWVSRFLFKLGVKKIIGIDISDNTEEQFESLQIDLFHYVESRKKQGGRSLITSELVDIIVNKDFTGFIGETENRSVSPSLFYGIEYELYKNNKDFSGRRFDLFKRDLMGVAYENLVNGGIYLVISANRYKIYKKEGDRFFLKEEGVYEGDGFFVGISEQLRF